MIDGVTVLNARRLEMRLRFWLYVARYAHKRIYALVRLAGHRAWWQDYETGQVFFDDEAARASAVSLEPLATMREP
jgi:hypothetical protein